MQRKHTSAVDCCCRKLSCHCSSSTYFKDDVEDDIEAVVAAVMTAGVAAIKGA